MTAIVLALVALVAAGALSRTVAATPWQRSGDSLLEPYRAHVRPVVINAAARVGLELSDTVTDSLLMWTVVGLAWCRALIGRTDARNIREYGSVFIVIAALQMLAWRYMPNAEAVGASPWSVRTVLPLLLVVLAVSLALTVKSRWTFLAPVVVGVLAVVILSVLVSALLR